MARKNNRTLGLQLEALETRENPAVNFTMMLPGGTLLISCDGGNDQVTVTGVAGIASVGVSDGVNTFSKVFTGVSNLHIMTGAGNDTINNFSVYSMLAYGGNGNDVINGGGLRDRIYGEAGNDILFGNSGNDALFGGSGADEFYGGKGNDFIDCNGFDTVVQGNDGEDMFTTRVVVNGLNANDVNQRGTPTCWILAPIAAAAMQGYDLESRIQYLGDGKYNVTLMNPDGANFIEQVDLSDGLYEWEAALSADSESWVTLFHRAICEKEGLDWKNNNFGNLGFGDFSSRIMKYLTDRHTDNSLAELGDSFDYSNILAMRNALNADKLVVAGTRKGDAGSFDFLGTVSTEKLVGSHVYAVKSINLSNKTMVVYNPWGVDMSKKKLDDGYGIISGDNDGFVTLSFQQFYDSFHYIAIS